MNDLPRRRSPGWVRAMPSRPIHGILGKFQRSRTSEDLSEPQEWLWDVLISELEYRHRRTRPVSARCCCDFCLPPFCP